MLCCTAQDGVAFCEPEQELPREIALQGVHQPVEEKGCELCEKGGQPEDGVPVEEVDGLAQEGSHGCGVFESGEV